MPGSLNFTGKKAYFTKLPIRPLILFPEETGLVYQTKTHKQALYKYASCKAFTWLMVYEKLSKNQKTT